MSVVERWHLWGWVLAWLGAKGLGRLERERDRAERARKQDLRTLKRQMALALKDRRESEWRAVGLNKESMLRDLGIQVDGEPASSRAPR